jgi:hypothetical protein
MKDMLCDVVGVEACVVNVKDQEDIFFPFAADDTQKSVLYDVQY